MSNYDVIIIGAGPGGIFAAYELAEKAPELKVAVFEAGNPLDHRNVTKRIWYPTLLVLGLTRRRPYQTRHTTATLWLASGESPEWIAQQLGHSTTKMLFEVYSRFIPNATRQDGSAFNSLIAST